MPVQCVRETASGWIFNKTPIKIICIVQDNQLILMEPVLVIGKHVQEEQSQTA